MKIFKRILLGTLVLIGIVLLIAVVFLFKIKRQAIPDYNANIQLKGLISEVNVLRDKQGIPHIYAENEHDLYLAVGYVMAQERLWQMDLLRRVTEGRLSEIFGARMLKSDLLLRSLRMQEKAKAVLADSKPELTAALSAFADGVNQYIESHQDKLPPEFVVLRYKPELWQPEHSTNLIGYMGWDLQCGWNEDILFSKLSQKLDSAHLWSIIPDMREMPTTVFPDFKLQEEALKNSLLSATDELKKLRIEVFNASNNWAVSGEKSSSGKPMLANDMHLGLNVPGIWLQMHQVIKGKLDVTGVVLPGQPLVICGHNDSIAWGMTNVTVDNLDFYQEKLNDQKTQYFFNGEWRPLKSEIIQIKTKEGTEETDTLYFTHRGPLVSKIKGIKNRQLSMRWSGNDQSNELQGIYLLNRSNNWNDFRNASRNFCAVSQNIAYADVKGNIGIQCSAGIPIRKGDGFSIYSGETDEYDWSGYVPFEELPFEYNPERAYVSSANNKTVSNDYPYFISHWFALPYRINRINQLLQAKEKLTVADLQAIQTDHHSLLDEHLLPYFLKALETKTDWNPLETKALELLKQWNGDLDKDGAGATIFEELFINLVRNTVSDEMGENDDVNILYYNQLCQYLIDNSLSTGNELWFDNVKTEKKETSSDVLIESFTQTVAGLSQKLGQEPAEWKWGKVHQLALQHPLGTIKVLDWLLGLNPKAYPVSGGNQTVSPYSYNYGYAYTAYHGASHRHVFDLSNWDQSETVIPTGISGIPSSPNYCDQTEMYVNDRYHSDPFSAKQVENKAVSRMKFLPE